MPPGSTASESTGSVTSTPRFASVRVARGWAHTRGALVERAWKKTVSSTCAGRRSPRGGSSGSIRTRPSSVSTARQPTFSPHSSCRAAQRRSPGATSVTAISERGPADKWLELEQQLSELDGGRVLGVHSAHDALDLRLHLVHELHRLEDAERLAGGND